MPEMLRTPERDSLIAFLERNLLQDMRLGDQDHQALRETLADRPTAGAAWTEAAARAVELLALPKLRHRWSALADRLTDFLLAMGEGPILHRQAATPGCRIDSTDPQDFRVSTAAYEFTGDLTRGLLRQRPAAGVEGAEVVHTGHLVEFTSGGANHCLDVEDSTSHAGVSPQPDGSVVLFHESLFSARAGLMRRTRFVARLRYEYTVRPDDPRVQLRVMLKTAPKVALRDIRLTTAVDEMSAATTPFGHLVLSAGGRTLPLSQPQDELTTLHLGRADALSLTETAAAPLATGVHLGFPSADRLMSIKLVSKAGDAGSARRPHWLLTRYRIPQLGPGQSATVEEERLVTFGTLQGAEATYASLLRDPAPLRGRDPGLARDIGAALNGMATQILFSTTSGHGGEARLAQMRQWYDRHAPAFLAAPPPRPRELAFALLSLDAMRRLPAAAGPDCAALLASGLNALLACQDAGGTFIEPGGAPDLGGHAAAILLLSRLAIAQHAIAQHGDSQGSPDPRLAAALRRALLPLQLGSMWAGQGEAARELPSPILHAATTEGGTTDDGRLSSRLGLAMRGLGVLILATRAGAVPLEPAERSHLETLYDSCFRLLRGRLRSSPEQLEVLADSDRADGDAITQSVVALALLAPDEAVLALPLAVPQPA